MTGFPNDSNGSSLPSGSTIGKTELNISLTASDIKFTNGQTVESQLVKTVQDVGDKTKLGTKSRSLSENISERGYNVKDFGAIGNGIADDTIAIQKVLDSAGSRLWGTIVYFPAGDYKITDTLKINRPLNIVGFHKYSTKIIQSAKGKDAITIGKNIERGSFKDIAIFGNDEALFGVNQTSGKGIVFTENSNIWDFVNVWIRGHSYGMYAGHAGHVNNINILNSEIEHCRYEGLHFVRNKEWQINAINIRDCNISGHGSHGISVWGNCVNISGNTIQGNHGAGISMNCDDVVTNKSNSGYTAFGMTINENYFELNRKGFIVGKAQYKAPYSLYLFGITITNNYGHQTPKDTDSGIDSLVHFSNPGGYIGSPQLRYFYLANNQFDGMPFIYDFEGKLEATSTVNVSNLQSTKGLGSATRIGRKSALVRGRNSTTDVIYDDVKSGNITKDSTIWFTIPTSENTGISSLSIPYKTDANVEVTLLFRTRNPFEIDSSYTELPIGFFRYNGVSKGNLFYGDESYAIEAENMDIAVGVRIRFINKKTYFYLGNPVITF